jgi:hypothetical protein
MNFCGVGKKEMEPLLIARLTAAPRHLLNIVEQHGAPPQSITLRGGTIKKAGFAPASRR